MIPDERYNRIMNLMNIKKRVTINELCEKLYCSRSTIRRDLIELEKSGKIKRIRGGARLISANVTEFSSIIRSNENTDAKKNIANIASRFLENDISMFIDPSSTAFHLCEYLLNLQNIVIITNSFLIPYTLAEYDNISCYCTGGIMKHHSHSFTGDACCSFLDNFFTDICFISTKCINPKGIYEADSDYVMTKRIIMKNSKKRVLMVDSSKFETSSFIKVSSLDDFDYIITDKKPNNYDQYLPEHKEKIIWE